MSDTPRTDQYVKMRASLAYCVDRDTSDFARQLERELAEVTKQRDELLEALNKLLDGITDIRGIDIELYAPKEIETAKQAIKKIKEKCND